MPLPASPSGLTEEAVVEHLKACAVDALELSPADVRAVGGSTPIVEGLRLDSLRQVVLLARIEEDFGFELDQEELIALGPQATVSDLARLILKRAAEVRGVEAP